MKIKKFLGPTVKDVTSQMKADLGPEAIILATRRVPRGGVFSFVGKDMVEVTAALDDSRGSADNSYAPQERESVFQRQLLATQKSMGGENTIAELHKIAEKFGARSAPEPRGAPADAAVHDGAAIHALKADMETMKATLRSIADHMKYEHMPSLPEYLQRAYVRLVQHDVDERLAADLVQSVYARVPVDQVDDTQTLESTLLETIAALVKHAGPEKRKRRKPRIVALVGPTGVGKTTTIAKLAALTKLVERKEVGLISTDTYRIGAIEQLRTFAAIADIPMEVVYRPSEMAGALRALKGKEVIYIDTVGRSHRTRRELEKIARFLEAADPDEIHLVMNASTNQKVALDILRQFRRVKPTRLLISKLDEAVTYGPLLNIASQQQLPLSYVTIGQAVPDDIRPVDSGTIASMVYRGEFAHA